MTCIANATTEPEEHEEIEITPEMEEAGSDVILSEVGRTRDLGGSFSAHALAVAVYSAMDFARQLGRPRRSDRTR
jgi:hypothetical protein